MVAEVKMGTWMSKLHIFVRRIFVTEKRCMLAVANLGDAMKELFDGDHPLRNVVSKFFHLCNGNRRRAQKWIWVISKTNMILPFEMPNWKKEKSAS